MARNFPDWLQAFTSYASYTESPKLLHFWAGVGTMAGALRRRVWFDQIYFKWYPSFYIVFVAPPGVVSKSTTADVGMDLLREVPGIKFGPDSVTWQQLVVAFTAAQEAYEYNGEFHTMSPLTLVASEFGNLIDFQDKQMVNLFITLWDGRVRFEKQTKTSGSDMVDAPWINMLACTTPQWIKENMSVNTIGGGFTSRCVFVYADRKEQLVPLLDEVVPKDILEIRGKLIQDLEYISATLVGGFTMPKETRDWMRKWYDNLWNKVYKADAEDYISGYVSRKQTHLVKLAMILSASRGDDLIISDLDLEAANVMLGQVESKFEKVFASIGKTEDNLQVEKFLQMIRTRGQIPYDEAYRLVHHYFSSSKMFEDILAGVIRAGYVGLMQEGGVMFLKWKDVNRAPIIAHQNDTNNNGSGVSH